MLQNNKENISDSKTSETQAKTSEDRGEESIKSMKVNLDVNNKKFTINLLKNESTKELIKGLPITIKMGDMNNNEKYYYMTKSLPTNNKFIKKIYTGDFMLYGSDCLVLFYETFSTNYRYTPLGSVEDINGLKEALGEGNVEVTLSMK